MKFNCTVQIEAPIHTVVELFTNPDNLKEWQDGFISHEVISGEPDSIGSKTRLIYDAGGRRIELVETLLAYDLPNIMRGEYVADTMTNIMETRMHALSENKTQLDVFIEYTKFNGIVPKLMGLFMSKLFKSQTQKWFNQFKTFVEKSVKEASKIEKK